MCSPGRAGRVVAGDALLRRLECVVAVLVSDDRLAVAPHAHDLRCLRTWSAR